MPYITDTHSQLWYFARPDRLGSSALDAFNRIAAGEEILFVPVIVLAELLFVIEKHKLNIDFAEMLQTLEVTSNVRISELSLMTVKSLRDLKSVSEMHDRLIVAEGIQVGAVLITQDLEITRSNLIKTVW